MYEFLMVVSIFVFAALSRHLERHKVILLLPFAYWGFLVGVFPQISKGLGHWSQAALIHGAITSVLSLWPVLIWLWWSKRQSGNN
jgi:hypothetical protein